VKTNKLSLSFRKMRDLGHICYVTSMTLAVCTFHSTARKVHVFWVVADGLAWIGIRAGWLVNCNGRIQPGADHLDWETAALQEEAPISVVRVSISFGIWTSWPTTNPQRLA